MVGCIEKNLIPFRQIIFSDIKDEDFAELILECDMRTLNKFACLII